jgi:PEGA domain
MAGGEWDRRADVFSLAVLMYELMSGKRVSGLGARATQNLTEIPDADLPMLRAVFARGLAENPADRYETALEFAEALKDACPDVVVAPEPAIAAPVQTARGDEPRLPLIEAAEGEATVLQPAPPPPASDRREPRRRSPRRDARDAGAAVDRTDLVKGVGPVDLDISAPPIAEPDVIYQSAAEMQHDPAPDEPASASPIGLIAGHDPGSISALDRTRSAVWPLVLALGVGVAIGFAGGFFAGSREQPTVTATTAREVTQNAAPGTAAAPKSEVRSQKSEGEVTKAEAQKAEPSNLKSAISNLQSPAAEGRILVRSRPAGAKVVVDGADYGLTPATVRGLARGAHRVKITRDGYAPEERRFVVTSSRPAQSMTVALAPARAVAPARAEAPTASTGRFAGALAVDSRPAGAKVFMDGTLVGTTPIALPSVPAGSHAIRLEYEGYRRWSSSVRVVASEQNRVTASLER